MKFWTKKGIVWRSENRSITRDLFENDLGFINQVYREPSDKNSRLCQSLPSNCRI
jgi:hypothetical protein